MLSGYLEAATVDRRFSLFLLAHSIDKVLHAPFNPFFPIFVAEVLRQPQAFAATFRGAETLAQTCASFGFGFISTNSRAKLALLLSLLNTPLAGLIFLTRSPPLLLALAAVHGALSGVASSVSSLYMISLAPEGKIGAAASLQYVGNTLGSAVGSAIGGVILSGHTSSGSGFNALALYMLIGALPVQLVVGLGLPSLTNGTTFAAPKTPPTASSSSSCSPKRAITWQLLQRPKVRALLIMQCLRTTFWGACSMSVPFLISATGGSKALVGQYSLGSLSSAMLAMLLGGGLSDRWTAAAAATTTTTNARARQTATSASFTSASTLEAETNDKGQPEQSSQLQTPAVAEEPMVATVSVTHDGSVACGCLLGLAGCAPLLGLVAHRQWTAGIAAAGWVATCLAWTVSGQIAPLTTIARVAGAR